MTDPCHTSLLVSWSRRDHASVRPAWIFETCKGYHVGGSITMLSAGVVVHEMAFFVWPLGCGMLSSLGCIWHHCTYFDNRQRDAFFCRGSCEMEVDIRIYIPLHCCFILWLLLIQVNLWPCNVYEFHCLLYWVGCNLPLDSMMEGGL